VVILFAISLNFVIVPLVTKNEDLNKELRLIQTKLKKYQWLLSQKDDIQNKYKQFTATLKLSDANKDPQVSALAELEEIAKEANIRIVDIRPQGNFEGAAYKEIIIELRTEGALQDYLKFIYTMENSLSLLRIEKFQLTAKANTQILEGSITVSRPSVLE
jgi:hypothetical protein